jgi:DNA (cytosine-5)-methyltransferase 1
MNMGTSYGIVDLFAGPGGLAEGFSKVTGKDGSRPFKIELSVEMEESAHETLLLRSFLRQFKNEDYPQPYFDALNDGEPLPEWSETEYRNQWEVAKHEAIRLELARDDEAKTEIDHHIDELIRRYDGNLGLIGGPPCQAYSIVGRSRNRGIADYVPEQDKRHYLYQEYIRILTKLQPAFFVMENVKGILSSRIDDRKVFDRILEDLGSVHTASGANYILIPIAPPSIRRFHSTLRPTDFIVRSEHFGIPQARHRVIVVGIRSDHASRLDAGRIATGLLDFKSTPTSAWTVLESMPPLRSRLSRSDDSHKQWFEAMQNAFAAVGSAIRSSGDANLLARFQEVRLKFGKVAPQLTTASRFVEHGCQIHDPELRNWIMNDRLVAIPNHEARSHMSGDLIRYLYSAIFAESHNRSPKAHEYPQELAPNHANWSSGKFADRFRVQERDKPSSTVTSHIAKDGHYYIHPDPSQCRSLTVREAARLQTFPDDYYFKGNRTQQYIQVGNAVPPFLAKQIGASIHDLLTGTSSQSKSVTYPVQATLDMNEPE